jgi:hypothetical protein
MKKARNQLQFVLNTSTNNFERMQFVFVPKKSGQRNEKKDEWFGSESMQIWMKHAYAFISFFLHTKFGLDNIL